MNATRFASRYESPIGTLFILATDEHIIEITFEPRSIYNLEPNTHTLEAANQLEAYFQGRLFEFNLPLKHEGTDFQLQVWQQLQHLAYGSTQSYRELAVFNPPAIRAIAGANAKNKLLIVVPCHRVIGSNGKLVGYIAGIWRKKWLLAHEQQMLKER